MKRAKNNNGTRHKVRYRQISHAQSMDGNIMVRGNIIIKLTSPSILSVSDVKDSEMATFSHALVSKNCILCWRASCHVKREYRHSLLR